MQGLIKELARLYLLTGQQWHKQKLDPRAAEWGIGHLPEKPPRMLWRTYEQITERAILAEEKREAILDVQLGRMMKRLGVLGEEFADLLGG